MAAQSTNEEYLIDAAPLTEPHFDEEATLLSARPVVPLQEVKAEENFRKGLLFGLAMAGSLMLGALGASFIYRQRGEVATTAISTAVPGAAGVVIEGPSDTTANAEAAGGAAAEKMAEADLSTVDKKSAAAVPTGATSNTVETKAVESPSSESEEPELTRAERIAERRLRRRAERQTQREYEGRPRRNSDGALRIREIFEGPGRPH